MKPLAEIRGLSWAVRGALAACLFAGAARADGIAHDMYVIPRVAEEAIIVDGALEDWAGVPNPIDMTRSDRLTYQRWQRHYWKGPADSSGMVHMAWTERGIFLAADVTDDILSQTEELDSWTWRGDHVDLRLYVPMGPQPDSAVKWQIGFVPGRFFEDVPKGDGPVAFAFAYFPEGAPLRDTRVASRLTEKGYIVEAFVPFSDIGLTEFEDRDGLLFDVNLSDSDSFPSIQSTMTSFGTRPRVEDPCLYALMWAGDESGRRTRRDRELARFGDLALAPEEERTLEFPGLLVPPDGKVRLEFRAGPAGEEAAKTSGEGLAVELNERQLSGDRLATVADGKLVYALDDLISLHGNKLVFRFLQENTGPTPAINVSGIRVLFVPDPIPHKAVW